MKVGDVNAWGKKDLIHYNNSTDFGSAKIMLEKKTLAQKA